MSFGDKISPRKIIFPGKGDITGQVVKGTKITFHFKTVKKDKKGDDVVIDDSKHVGQPMELLIGKQFKLVAWEEILKSMKVGEVCETSVDKSLLIDYPFVSKCYRQYVKKEKGEHDHDHQDVGSHCCGMKAGMGYQDLDELMKEPQDLKFTFELIKVEPPDQYEKEVWQMEEVEQFDSIAKFREEGNRLYAMKNLKEASQLYAKALGIIEQFLLKEKPGDEEWIKLDQMKVPLLCNYAQCLLLEGEYYQAIKHTTDALERDKDNVKALFRRAKAHAAVWDVEEAKRDFNKVISLDASLESAVQKELKTLKEQEKNKSEDDKKLLKGKLFA